MLNDKPLRKIKSFVRRDGRLTAAQREAIEKNWSKLTIQPPLQRLRCKNQRSSSSCDLIAGSRTAMPILDPVIKLQEDEKSFLNFREDFKREAPFALEIGFGSGQSLLEAAVSNTEINFIGIETHLPGIGALLHHIEARGIQNIRIIYADAYEVLQNVQDQTFSMVQIFFPDPWPKRKHHKRRLIQPEFVQLLTKKMKTGGTLHIATDWEDYAKHIFRVLNNESHLKNVFDGYAPRSAQRPLITKFEQRGLNEGRHIWEFQFTSHNPVLPACS